MTVRLLAAMALLLPFAPVRADDAPQGLDGQWEIKSRPGDAEKPPDAPRPLLTIKGDALTLKFGDDATHARIKVDASQTPKAIDMTPQDGPDQGRTSLGIFEIKGDELRFYYAEPGKDRPKDFPKEGVAVWERVRK